VEDDDDAREDTPLFFSGTIFDGWMDGWVEIGDVIGEYDITRPGTRGLKRASASSNFSCFCSWKDCFDFSALSFLSDLKASALSFSALRCENAKMMWRRKVCDSLFGAIE
jgi:hypothetical protein